MKSLLGLILLLQTAILFGQNPTGSDTIELPVYDTTSIEIRSTNSFYFCSKLYKIPRDCDSNDQSNCCSFNAQIHKALPGLMSGQISCYDGTSLFWTYFDNVSDAKQSFEGYPGQIKKQMKTFKQEDIKLFVCNTEVVATKLSYTTLQGYKLSEIRFYGTINGQTIHGHLSLQQKKSSEELTPFFRQLVRF